MQRHEVEGLRRSFAMAGTLTEAQIRVVLEELDQALARPDPEVRRILDELAK